MVTMKCKRKYAAAFLWILLMWSAAPLFAGSPIWAPEPLNQIIANGLAHNQELQSMKSLIQSMEEEAGFSSSLPDPMIGIGILNLPVDSFRLDQEPMTQKQIFISQKFPWFGKLDLQSGQVMKKARRMQALLKAKELEVSRNIAEHYYDLAFVRHGLFINQKLREILDQSVAVARSRYATGRGLQPDILQGQVEISRLEDERNRLQKMKQVAISRMLALMNLESADWPHPMEEQTAFPLFQWNTEKIYQLALHHNPLLKAKEAEIELSEAGVDLARKDSYPDIDVRLAYGQRDESRNGNDWADFVSASFSMNIPVWKKNRQDKKVASRLAEKKSAEESYQNLFAMLPHRIDVILAEMENNQKSYTLFQEKLIPQTQEWSLSALSAYEVGKIEFSTMINARMRVLRFQLEAQKILFDIYKNRAVLEEMIGIPIDDLETTQEGATNHE